MKISVFRLALPLEVGRYSPQVVDHLGILALYRLAANVPVPGVDFAALKAFREQRRRHGRFPGFPGSAFRRYGLQFLTAFDGRVSVHHCADHPAAADPDHPGSAAPDAGRSARRPPLDGKWTYFLAVPMAALSAIGQINIFNSLSVQALNKVIVPFGFTADLWLPSLTILLAMTAGTMFAIWLGELISEYGIRGQGLSLIIFAGIVARMPANLASPACRSIDALRSC